MSTTLVQQSAYSRLFSSAVFREMALKGKSVLFARLLKEAPVLGVDLYGTQVKVRDAFDAAFNVIRAVELRDEYVYKAALTHKILLGKHSLRTASMLSEFRVGECKADIVILNGTATAYEIKSERDSLSRLSKQIESYKKVFASVYVIAGENHVASVLDLVEQDVGVLQLSKRNQISTVRDAINLPGRICPLTVLDSLRTDEAIKIVGMLGFVAPNVPNTRIRAELKTIFNRVDPQDLHVAMVSTLKKTRDLAPLAELVDGLPQSLHAAALSVPIKKKEYSMLFKAINTRLDEALNWN